MSSHPLTQIEDWASVARQCHYHSSTVARHFNVSVRTLERLFRIKFNISPQRWFNQQRQREIEQLALAGARTKEIAGKVGLAQPSYLCRIFKRGRGTHIKAFKQMKVVAKR